MTLAKAVDLCPEEMRITPSVEKWSYMLVIFMTLAKAVDLCTEEMRITVQQKALRHLWRF